jgi:hypothetical protein
MNNLIASLTPSIARFVLILSASFAFSATAYADELKEISQLADQGQTAVALDRVNTFIAANPKKPARPVHERRAAGRTRPPRRGN